MLCTLKLSLIIFFTNPPSQPSMHLFRMKCFSFPHVSFPSPTRLSQIACRMDECLIDWLTDWLIDPWHPPSPDGKRTRQSRGSRKGLNSRQEKLNNEHTDLQVSASESSAAAIRVDTAPLPSDCVDNAVNSIHPSPLLAPVPWVYEICGTQSVRERCVGETIAFSGEQNVSCFFFALEKRSYATNTCMCLIAK